MVVICCTGGCRAREFEVKEWCWCNGNGAMARISMEAVVGSEALTRFSGPLMLLWLVLVPRNGCANDG